MGHGTIRHDGRCESERWFQSWLIQLNNGGALYPAQSLNYNNIQVNDTSLNFINLLTFGGSVSIGGTYSYTALMTLGWPHETDGNDFDSAMICNSSCSNYDVVQFTNSCDGTHFILGARIHHNPSTAANCTYIFNQQSVYVAVTRDSTNGVSCEWVFTPQGTFLPNPNNGAGHPETCYANVGGSVDAIRIPSNESEASAGNFSEYQNIMMRWTVPSPTGSATFTNGNATVTGSGFPTDNSWNNGVFWTGGTSYQIATCNGGGGTTCTLVTTFADRTGSSAYAVELPLFWTQTDPWAGVVAPPRASSAWSSAGVTGGIPTGRTQCVTANCNGLTSGSNRLADSDCVHDRSGQYFRVATCGDI